MRYHARDVADLARAARGVPVVLGSATPSLETWSHARAGRYRRLDAARARRLRARAAGGSLRADARPRAHDGICDPLRDALAARLARGEQSLVFVNRRGFAPSLMCAACAWEADARAAARGSSCIASRPTLRCHHCGHAERLPRACPSCGNVDLLPLGLGTQRLERALARGVSRRRASRASTATARARAARSPRARSGSRRDAIDILSARRCSRRATTFRA